MQCDGRGFILLNSLHLFFLNLPSIMNSIEEAIAVVVITSNGNLFEKAIPIAVLPV